MPQTASVLTGNHVLVVEDNYLLARELLKALELDGAIVVGPVACVADALDLLDTARVDAALLDIQLNAETSYPIAERLISDGKPFVFVSSTTDVPEEHRGRCIDKMSSVATIALALFPLPTLSLH